MTHGRLPRPRCGTNPGPAIGPQPTPELLSPLGDVFPRQKTEPNIRDFPGRSTPSETNPIQPLDPLRPDHSPSKIVIGLRRYSSFSTGVSNGRSLMMTAPDGRPPRIPYASPRADHSMRASRAPRRWYRGGLHGLMAAVLVVGGVSGWMAHVIRTQRAAVAVVKEAGGWLIYDWQTQDLGTKPGPNGPVRIRPTGPDAPAILRRWLGDELFQTVERVGFDHPVTPETMAELSRLAHLDMLVLLQNEPIATDLTPLRDQRRLTVLQIRAAAATDASLGQIAQLDSLKTLAMQWSRPHRASPMTDAGLVTLGRLPNLESLTIDDCPLLTDAGVARLVEGLPKLRRLTLNGGLTSVTRLLPSLARHHPGLTSLTLNGAAVHPKDYPELVRLRNLEALELQGVSVGDAGLAQLRPLRGLKTLMTNDAGITDAGLVHLASSSRLESLFLIRSPITDAGVMALARLPKLQFLDISRTLVTPAGVAALRRAASPSLRIIHAPRLVGRPALPASTASPANRSTPR